MGLARRCGMTCVLTSRLRAGRPNSIASLALNTARPHILATITPFSVNELTELG